MNAQIKQFVQQATGPVIVRKWDDENHCHYNETEFKLDLEKFAELIINECALLFDAEATTVGPDLKKYHIHSIIKNHFGIKE